MYATSGSASREVWPKCPGLWCLLPFSVSPQAWTGKDCLQHWCQLSMESFCGHQVKKNNWQTPDDRLLHCIDLNNSFKAYYCPSVPMSVFLGSCYYYVASTEIYKYHHTPRSFTFFLKDEIFILVQNDTTGREYTLRILFLAVQALTAFKC